MNEIYSDVLLLRCGVLILIFVCLLYFDFPNKIFRVQKEQTIFTDVWSITLITILKLFFSEIDWFPL